MEVNKLAAARVRARFLLERADIYLKDGSDVALEWAWDDLDECLYLLDKACYTEKAPQHNNKYTVTEEMRQQALSYPIDRLIRFNNHNRAIAWCHKDNLPSLNYNPVKNKCFCNPCNKAFNSIDVVMHIEGLRYYDAIRRLCV